MMKKYLAYTLTLALLALASCTAAPARPQPVAVGQHPEVFKKEIRRTVELHYLLYLPEDYGKTEQRWPLVLFLHGSGERGSDLKKVAVNGPPMLVAQGQQFPFILVSPQCPVGQSWDVKDLELLLDEITSKYAVDENRVYVTGLSMGGFGTWKLAIDQPKRFAAIAPLCGGGEAFMTYLIKDVPVWVFHGAKDNVVPMQRSQEMVDALKRFGANPRFTVYLDAGHNCWTETYNNPELYSWMLAQHRQPTTQPSTRPASQPTTVTAAKP